MNKTDFFKIAYEFTNNVFSDSMKSDFYSSLSSNIIVKHIENGTSSDYDKSSFSILVENVYKPIIEKYAPRDFKELEKSSSTVLLKAILNSKPYFCELIISITIDERSKEITSFETNFTRKVSGIPGGVFTFANNKNFNITSLSQDIVKFFNYSSEQELLIQCNASLVSVIDEEELNSLRLAIKDASAKNRSFSINIHLHSIREITFNVYLNGKIINKNEDKQEIFAHIILKELVDDGIDYYDSLVPQFIDIIQNYPLPIFYKDLNGIYRLVNLAYINEFEIDNLDQMLSHTDAEFFKLDGSKFQNSDSKIISREIAYSESYNYLEVNGKKFYCRTYKVPVCKSHGIVGVLGIVSNISKEKAYKEKLQMKEIETDYIFSNSDTPYYIKNKYLRFVKVNEKFCTIFNTTENEILDKRIEDILPKNVINSSLILEEKALQSKKGQSVSETMTIDLNNRLKYFNLKITPLFDEKDNIYRLIGKLEDITATIEKENRIIRLYNLDLDKTISQKSLDYIRIDVTTGVILFKKINNKLFSNKNYNDKLIATSKPFFIYDFEYNDFINKYSIDALRDNIKQNKVTSFYTAIFNDKLFNVEINHEYYTNPTNKHTETVLTIRDITQIVDNKEMIELFSKVEFDFIVKLSFVANYLVCTYINTNHESDFVKLKENHKIETFLSILYKDATTEVPSVEKWHDLVKKLLEKDNHNTYIIETKTDKRKNISVKLIDEKRQSILVASQDLTKTTQHDRKLQKQLRKLALEAQNADNVKTEFLSRMSHDMRTPLTAIIGLSKFGIDECKNTTCLNYFNKIQSSGQYLSVLLNDVLEIQKIESGELELNNKPFYLLDTIEQVKTMVYPRTIEKNIIFEIVTNVKESDFLYLNNDEIRLSEILVNLLNNSIKYTPNGGRITWTYEIQQNPLILHTKITDNGIGMSKDFQKRMFNKFTQEHNIYSGAEGGSGLGLSIVKNLVDLLDGNIECKSKLNMGTTFIIDIPLNKSSKEELEKFNIMPTYLEYENLFKKRILLCEDTLINTIIVEKILSKYNIKVNIAKNGEIGVNMARENNYDAILMDIRMPIMNGLQAAAEIRKFNKTIPIIALSANAYKEDIDKSLNVGMNAHLSKPIDSEKLFSVLAKNLSK